MTKYYFIRKNKIIHCRETGTKGNYKRVWYKPRICSDLWQPYEVHTERIAAQFEEELKQGKLTVIPDKLMQKNKNAWRNEKDNDVEVDEVRE